MSRYCLSVFVAAVFVHTIGLAAEDQVFSGPQVGEKLPPFKAKGVFGELAGKELDIIQQADGKPIALIFVHARTRPAFGLSNAIMRYAASKSKDGLESAVVFLTEDATTTEKWMHTVERHFAKGVKHCISVDGIEGPGSYGLNRNVTLTVLVGKGDKVTANFALVQPSLPADGPKILEAIVDATGGGEVPKIAELAGARYARMDARSNDPKLTTLLRAVINKQATPEEVEKAAKAVEAYVDSNENARSQLGRIATSVVGSGRLKTYGTEPAQETLRTWLKKYGDPDRARKSRKKRN